MKPTALLALTLFCAAAGADEQRTREFIAKDQWHHYADTASGGKVFTKGAVRLKPGRYQVWFKLERSQPKECGSNGNNAFMRSPMDELLCDQVRRNEVGQSLNLLDVDCSAGKTRVIETIDYNFDDAVIYRADRSDEKWGRIIPDTIGADLYSSMCETESSFDR